MRVLLDECVPRRFRQALVGAEVSTTRDERWDGLRNGDLLAPQVLAAIAVTPPGTIARVGV